LFLGACFSFINPNEPIASQCKNNPIYGSDFKAQEDELQLLTVQQASCTRLCKSLPLFLAQGFSLIYFPRPLLKLLIILGKYTLDICTGYTLQGALAATMTIITNKNTI